MFQKFSLHLFAQRTGFAAQDIHSSFHNPERKRSVRKFEAQETQIIIHLDRFQVFSDNFTLVDNFLHLIMDLSTHHLFASVEGPKNSQNSCSGHFYDQKCR